METLYFVGFCIFIAVIIFWGFRNDDFAEFVGSNKDKKFSLTKNSNKPSPKNDTDDDEPKANLL